MKTIQILRIGSCLLLVCAALLTGWLARSPWIVLPMALIYTEAFVLGRWPAWRLSWRADSWGSMVAKLASTAAVQAILVGVLYLMGRGVSAVFGNPQTAEFSSWDWLYCAAVAVVSGLLGVLVIWWEQRYGSVHDELLKELSQLTQQSSVQAHGSERPARAEIALLPEPVTLQSFYSGPHYTHSSDSGSTVKPEAHAGEQAIAAAEQRLGVVLPAALRALYRHQNGGSINSLCVPKPGIAQPRLFDDLVLPFGGYDDLLPCELLRTLYDSVCDYADPETPEGQEMFPAGSERMVILAQWYRHTLFLDYSNSEPKVGFVDFDHHADWQQHCVWWDSFAQFYGALRHYESL